MDMLINGYINTDRQIITCDIVILIMEETIRIFLLSQETTVSLASIVNLQPLLPQSRLREVRLPFQMKKFKSIYKVFNACLHYVFSIQKNLPHSFSAQFRQKCLLEISSYYIRRRMNFQLYQYAYLCSKILCIPIEKVMHIIYFMIYARLASKPYINNIIAQSKHKTKKHRHYTVKSENNDSINSQSLDSRHMTVFWENNHLEIQSFRKDLKQILSSEGQSKKPWKKNQNKRYFNIKNIYPDQEDFINKSQNQSENPLFCDEPKVVNIPLKVGAFENSSVIERIKHSQSSIFSDKSKKKIQVRRQKFNENFDYVKKYEFLTKDGDIETKRNPWDSTDITRIDHQQKMNSTSTRLQKHHFNYFSAMATNIKANNKQLDAIRTQCMSQKIKKSSMLKEYEWNRHEKTLEMKIKTAQITPRSKISKPEIEKTETIEQKENQIEEIVKKFSINRQPENKEQQEKKTREVGNVGLITRKANNINQQGKLMLFNKKLKSKFKIQKYKDQYRQFLKTQMFERQKNNF